MQFVGTTRSNIYRANRAAWKFRQDFHIESEGIAILLCLSQETVAFSFVASCGLSEA